MVADVAKTNDSGAKSRGARWVVAAVLGGLLLAAGALLGRLCFSKPGYHRQGPLVWIDGEAYVDANRLLAQREMANPPPVWAETHGQPTNVVAPPLGSTGMRASQPVTRSPDRTLAPGETLKSESQPCRVMLGKGRVAYLNRNTVLSLESPGEITLLQGEVYLEIGPIGPARLGTTPVRSSAAMGAGLEPGFVVTARGREVVTRSAWFSVRVERDATRVLVLRGKVVVDDDHVVQGGQQVTLQKAENGVKPQIAVVPRPLDAIAWTRGLMGEGGKQPSEFDPGKGRFFTSVHQGDKYLLLRWQPELPGEPKHERHDWVFLVESSADRDPVLARRQIEIVRTILDNAEPDDTFAVLTAGTFVQALAPRREMATPDNAARAIRFLEQTHLFGALDLQRALAAAEPYLRVPKNPVLVHVGSGMPILGQRDVDALVRQIPESVRYVGIGVGVRWQRALMDAAATRTDGYFTRVLSGSDIRWRTMELLTALDLPRLLDVRVTDPSGKLEFRCSRDTLAQGESLQAIARIDVGSPLPASVEVAGLVEGKTRRWTIPLTSVAESHHDLSVVWTELQPGGTAAARASILANRLRSALTMIPRALFAACQIEFVRSCMLARAERTLGPILENTNCGRCPWLWRLAATLSDRRGRTARAVFCWEHALELQYGDRSDTVNVRRLRNDYGWLLAQYPKLSTVVATDRAAPLWDLVERVIHAADRWRRLDPDPVPACRAAAKVLRELGAHDVARGYATTPLATMPE